MSVSAAELLMLVPAGTAAGTMLVVVTLNGLATIERRVSQATGPAPSAQPRVPPQRQGLTEAPPVVPDEAASRPNAPPMSSPRRLRHTRVHRYGYRPHGRLPRPPIKLACGAAPDAATSIVPTEPAEESR
ncbi:MAG TPA: hypothetical protein VG779_04865 [Actinomycetota bacterium]|nr:hypothetical protein [Actinomycetota bacterium]